MINPEYFTSRILKIAFNITLDSHHTNHANSKVFTSLKYSGTEIRYVNKTLKEMATIYAR